MTDIKIYTTQDLENITERLSGIKARGKVTGVSAVAKIKYIPFIPIFGGENRVGFYLDNWLFCETMMKDALRASAWLDQNKGKEVFIKGDYEPWSKVRCFMVDEFYKDSQFKIREI